jgi:hypothetical protein
MPLIPLHKRSGVVAAYLITITYCFVRELFAAQHEHIPMLRS